MDNDKERRYAAVKEPATIKAQLDKLVERGCRIQNMDFAAAILENINYYRLVDYFSPFKIDNKSYRPGTDFAEVLSIYDFDRRLRNELLTELEEVEVAFRAVVSNYHALKYGALGYLNPSSYTRGHNHKQLLSKIERLLETNGDQPFVRHHETKYGAFPLWVIMELFSFGMLACFYDDLFPEDKEQVAKRYYGADNRQLASWMQCLAELRNHCAHYNRLYGVELSRIPRDIGAEKPGHGASLFTYIMVMKRVCRRPEAWNNGFSNRLPALLAEYDMVQPEMLGFPPDWAEKLRIVPDLIDMNK